MLTMSTRAPGTAIPLGSRTVPVRDAAALLSVIARAMTGCPVEGARIGGAGAAGKGIAWPGDAGRFSATESLAGAGGATGSEFAVGVDLAIGAIFERAGAFAAKCEGSFFT